MAQKSGLGRGLDALIPGWQEKPAPIEQAAGSVLSLPVGQISPNPHQPRKKFDPESLEELADSIREHGIISPLVVVSTEQADRFVLIAGERRLRAAKLAGLKEVPAIVRTATEQEQLEFAIIENVQREDLNAIERARAYQSLIDSFALTHDDIARRVGKNRVTVTNTLRLLNLPPSVQKALQDELISEGHARVLLSLASVRLMETALDSIQTLGLNVRQTELLINRLNGKVPVKPSPVPPTPAERDLENRLRTFFHTKVALQKSQSGGSITIYYYSDEDLNTITSQLGLND
jgi:ParB family chromosome partitioning protein